MGNFKIITPRTVVGGAHIIMMDSNGHIIYTDTAPMLRTFTEMLVPVQCNMCNKIYDLCDGKILHRYMDCTEYMTPCCNKRVDDREWVTHPAFTRIDKKDLL